MSHACMVLRERLKCRWVMAAIRVFLWSVSCVLVSVAFTETVNSSPQSDFTRSYSWCFQKNKYFLAVVWFKGRIKLVVHSISLNNKHDGTAVLSSWKFTIKMLMISIRCYIPHIVIQSAFTKTVHVGEQLKASRCISDIFMKMFTSLPRR